MMLCYYTCIDIHSFRMPDYFHSPILGYSFWIDESNTFMSAPTFKDDTVDIDNAIAVSDWQNFNELNEFDLRHLFGSVLTMCLYKRDLIKIEYYADKFLPKVTS